MRTRAWRDVEEVARTVAPAAEWRAALASRLRVAADASFAAVITCAPSDWNRLRFDADPPELARLVERISNEFVPRIERVGEDWRYALQHHGRVYAPLETARARDLAADLRQQVLLPVEIDGYVVAFFATGSPPLLYGFAALGARDAASALLARTRPLEQVTAHAAGTLRSALSLAHGCGAALPSAAASTRALTSRERQIAELAAAGYSNVNVAARLSIAEATVAVHLRGVYRKLGVHSRVELLAALRE